jgi:alginate O-acetyltransferase complex protein AlgI
VGIGAGGSLLINSYQFWMVAAAAVVLLRVVVEPRTRSYLWAGLNLIFLGLLLGKYFLAMAGPALCVFALLQAYRWVGRRLLLTSVLIFSATVLFALYKTAYFTHQADAPWVQQVLAAVGFSFVFLRLIDLTRGVQEERHTPPNLPDFINYLLPFHMLAAGPIQSYDDFASQPRVAEPLNTREALNGANRIAWGLFKKFVLAYALQKAFLTDLSADGIWFFIEIQLLLVWLYLDFSAYSDVAVGLGRLMGVATPENFNRPWLARNLIEFWDRWHISLSSWIRRNLFIPTQLNLMRRYPRVDPVLIAAAAIGLSFFMAGIWHGLSPGWLLWGGAHAVGLVTTRLYIGVMQRRRTPAQLAAYRSNKLILFAARCVTFEYAALVFAIPFILK